MLIDAVMVYPIIVPERRIYWTNPQALYFLPHLLKSPKRRKLSVV